MTAQRHLNLSINQRTVLVTLDTVRASLGVDADSIIAKVDAGELRWVWNVSNGTGEVRELRFWAREIVAPELTRELTPAKALELILGDSPLAVRKDWRGVEIAQLLLVSRPQIFRLHEAGELPGVIVGGTLKVKREALKTFLRTRLVGAFQTA
jgi:excisionase family DNA binding protein